MEQKKYPIETVRHSLSHVLAMAVVDMFPEVKLGIGPAIDTGFYYDFELPMALSAEDLPKLEKKMREIINSGASFKASKLVSRSASKQFENQPYKVELIKDLEASGETEVSIYQSGDFVDLCAGPHVESTKDLKGAGWKLDKIAGAYWKGSEKNSMMTRIYGLAFESREGIEQYLKNREEAEKRDHRKLGRELDLFHIDEEVGLGLVLWHPRGAIIWRVIEDFWYKEHLKNGYQLVRSPHIGNRRLWEKSGHWGFYNSSMYPPMEAGQSLEDRQLERKVEKSEEYLLKPMNCPFHVQIYKNSPHSYREFPFRWAEIGTVYRFEKTGELSGLTRVRGFTQDDAHIVCRKDQVKGELKRVVDFILFIYKSFGFDLDSVNVYLSLRDPANKSKYAGNDEGWEFTEQVLREVATEKSLSFKEELGEAAFYGPKLDFKVRDVLGREWQLSTLQFDFNLPERFNMTFVNEKGEEEQPYMLHRALFGSFERFIGLLIEHYAGAFPVWLAPVQAIVLPIADRHQEYANSIGESLQVRGVRVEIDLRSESIGRKIRDAEIQKIPYMLIVGDKEVGDNKVAVRRYGEGDKGPMAIEKLISEIQIRY